MKQIFDFYGEQYSCSLQDTTHFFGQSVWLKMSSSG